MKAHQRIIREKEGSIAASSNLFGAWWDEVKIDLDLAQVKLIDYETAKSIILRYEWLGNMGTTEYAFGLYFDVAKNPSLGGVVCFGRTSGTNAYSSVCGEENKNRVITLCRGACVHWAHKHSASFLISQACKLMTMKGFNIFLAYADPFAGEIGTVYQACNWFFCGTTNPTEKFITPNGEIKDARLVHAYTRDRRGNKLRYKRSRSEQKKMMIDQGYRFVKGNSKFRYVGIYGSNLEKRFLKRALQWPILDYPKRS